MGRICSDGNSCHSIHTPHTTLLIVNDIVLAACPILTPPLPRSS